MIDYNTVGIGNFQQLKYQLAKDREDASRQGEALSGARALRKFAEEHNMKDEVVSLFLEEALVFQHSFMADRNDLSSLDGMKGAVEGAKLYVEENGLSGWESRVARFLGRVADYEKNYQEAVMQYQKAIDMASNDRDFSANPAVVLEYKGFLMLSKIRMGEIDDGVSGVESLVLEYDQSAEGKKLKDSDYTTWAIWKSGLLINLIKGLLDLGRQMEMRDKISSWLSEAEKVLAVPEGVSVWSDFGFRKKEIEEIRTRLAM